jgi:hypothetical protein
MLESLAIILIILGLLGVITANSHRSIPSHSARHRDSHGVVKPDQRPQKMRMTQPFHWKKVGQARNRFHSTAAMTAAHHPSLKRIATAAPLPMTPSLDEETRAEKPGTT